MSRVSVVGITSRPILDKFMVAFKVESLFNNIPFVDSMNLVVYYLLSGNADVNIIK